VEEGRGNGGKGGRGEKGKERRKEERKEEKLGEEKGKWIKRGLSNFIFGQNGREK
jgi:ribosomal protein L15